MIIKEKDKVSSKGIKVRLVGNFMLIILISVIAFEGLLIYFTKYYFYKNVEGVLTNQIKIASDFYGKYFSNVDLKNNVLDNVDVFWRQTTAQVQIIEPTGRILMDSVGVLNKEPLDSSDFKDALKDEKGIFIGNEDYNKEKVIAISYPLKSDGRIVGVLRFISSLKEIDKVILNISLILISIGVIVILIAGAISIIIAHSIVHPLKEVTSAAELMASGNLKIRINKEKNDEIGRLADTLNFMAEEIEKRDRIKNEFISLVSHELRTPLTSIKGWAITLKTDETNDRDILYEGLNIIEKESDRLTAMVEELLDFSRLVSGKVTLKREKTDIIKILEYIEKYMGLRAKRERINFKVVYEELPFIEVDKDRIKQVLINLLDNAFKFTSPGGNVVLSALGEENLIILKVEDTGCGIGREELPHIKEKFYKGKNSKSQTGLGLSICDEIIQMHNGSLSIESELNKGTSAIISIPLKIENKGEKSHETKI